MVLNDAVRFESPSAGAVNVTVAVISEAFLKVTVRTGDAYSVPSMVSFALASTHASTVTVRVLSSDEPVDRIRTSLVVSDAEPELTTYEPSVSRASRTTFTAESVPSRLAATETFAAMSAEALKLKEVVPSTAVTSTTVLAA